MVTPGRVLEHKKVTRLPGLLPSICPSIDPGGGVALVPTARVSRRRRVIVDMVGVAVVGYVLLWSAVKSLQAR